MYDKLMQVYALANILQMDSRAIKADIASFNDSRPLDEQVSWPCEHCLSHSQKAAANTSKILAAHALEKR